jgi:hypothetical protein
METILAHAQQLVYLLLSLMPSPYQRENLQAMLGLFLEAQGHPLPQHSQTKSASALSRFLSPFPLVNSKTHSHDSLVYTQTNLV